MGKPSSYVEQVGCHNCKHVFERYDYDSGQMHFCTFKAPQRPKCGSSQMGETWTYPDDIKAEAPEMTAWYEWAKGRTVEAYGTCMQWGLSDAFPAPEEPRDA